ncbi:MAG: hypothetical protein WAT66_04745 [Actinomycetota bacterium]
MPDIDLGSLVSRLKLDTKDLQRGRNAVKDALGRMKGDFAQAGTGIGRSFEKILGDSGAGATSSFAKNARTQLTKGARDAGEAAGKETGTRFGSSLNVALGALGGAFVAKRISSFFKDSIQALAEAEKVSAQTAAVIRSTGAAAGISADEVGKLAGRLEDLTTVDDKAIQGAANLLLTFTQVRNELGKGNDIFDQAVAIATDMSVALGQDLSGSAIQLGKALNDPIRGVTALRRVGVSFTQEQLEQIRVLVESGRVLEAQKLILRELTTEFGGSAKAIAGTTQGALNRAGDAVEELRKKVGASTAPIVNVLGDLAAAAADVPGPVVAVGAAFAGLVGATLAIRGMRAALRTAAEEIDKIPGLAGRAGTALSGLARAGGLVATLVGAGKAAQFLGDKINDIGRGEHAVDRLTAAVVALSEGTGSADNVFAKSGRSLKVVRNETEGAVRGISGFIDRISRPLPGRSSFELAARDLDQIDTVLADLVRGGAADKAEAAFLRMAKALKIDPKEAKQFFDEYAASVEEAAAQSGVAAAASTKLAAATSELSEEERDQLDPLGELSDAQLKVAGRYAQTSQAIETFQGVLERSLGVVLGVREATSTYEAAIDELAASLKENGRTLDLNTEKGRANDESLRSLISSAEDLVEARVRSGRVAADEASQTAALDRILAGLARRFPGLRGEINSYRSELGKIPREKKTTITLETPGRGKIAGVTAQLSKNIKAELSGISIAVTPSGIGSTPGNPVYVKQVLHEGGLIMHGGGPVTGGLHRSGFGSGEVGIVARLGEFMMQNRAVDVIGLPTLRAMNDVRSRGEFLRLFQGWPRLHAGGLVSAAVARTSSVTHSPTDARVFTNQYTVTIHAPGADAERIGLIVRRELQEVGRRSVARIKIGSDA